MAIRKQKAIESVSSLFSAASFVEAEPGPQPHARRVGERLARAVGARAGRLAGDAQAGRGRALHDRPGLLGQGRTVERAVPAEAAGAQARGGVVEGGHAPEMAHRRRKKKRRGVAPRRLQSGLLPWGEGLSSLRRTGPVERAIPHAPFTPERSRGRERRRRPVAAKTALAIDGPRTGTPGSPIPVGATWLGTM